MQTTAGHWAGWKVYSQFEREIVTLKKYLFPVYFFAIAEMCNTGPGTGPEIKLLYIGNLPCNFCYYKYNHNNYVKRQL